MCLANETGLTRWTVVFCQVSLIRKAITLGCFCPLVGLDAILSFSESPLHLMRAFLVERVLALSHHINLWFILVPEMRKQEGIRCPLFYSEEVFTAGFLRPPASVYLCFLFNCL